MLALREKTWDTSDSSDDERAGATAPMVFAAQTRVPRYAPPSLQPQVAPVLEATAKLRMKSVMVVDDGMHGFGEDSRAVPVATMPPMPNSPGPLASPSIPMPPEPTDQPVGGGLWKRSKSQRRTRTIKELIDGWWDLGLLEAQKRQTMLANKGLAAAPSKRD
ncbi:hypothetical protein D7B24_000199 [Verticillium nonalfalfae]|uniref:Uncharacterized protein n=1 Tax=Verticillium nonalfalfae TaxID=1051616 RepID=A0A3M9YHZ8_9PEZI|nr:uncharacterized protein D7B24_000199 [Verticillium nonalfalfae]RNJ60004.1 hypothetical protein D7B24_000199 [Verticillium nonalfalfae]